MARLRFYYQYISTSHFPSLNNPYFFKENWISYTPSGLSVNMVGEKMICVDILMDYDLEEIPML